MQYHVTFTVGIGEDRKGRAITDADGALIVNAIGVYLADNKHAFTLTRGTGHWEGIHEPVAVFTSDMWAEMAEITHMASRMAIIADQTAVHVSATQTYAVNITQEGSIDDGS